MQMKPRLLGCSVLLFASAGAVAEPAGVSTFDTGLEGWTAFMSSSIDDPTPTGELPLVWDPVGGFPGGAAAATVTSQFGAAWFSAPAEFLGDKSFLMNQATIRFNVKVQRGSAWLGPDIYIAGAGMVLGSPMGSGRQPGQWTVQYPLVPSPAYWHCVSGPGCAVTPEVFHQVLSDVTGLWLLAENRDGTGPPDTIWLDNVSMIPEPATGALLGIGLAALLARARRASIRPH